ncbi:MAG: hypothetical protein ABH863_01020 [Candidatus Micrarchaeota archaeon]
MERRKIEKIIGRGNVASFHRLFSSRIRREEKIQHMSSDLSCRMLIALARNSGLNEIAGNLNYIYPNGRSRFRKRPMRNEVHKLARKRFDEAPSANVAKFISGINSILEYSSQGRLRERPEMESKRYKTIRHMLVHNLKHATRLIAGTRHEGLLDANR